MATNVVMGAGKPILAVAYPTMMREPTKSELQQMSPIKAGRTPSRWVIHDCESIHLLNIKAWSMGPVSVTRRQLQVGNF